MTGPLAARQSKATDPYDNRPVRLPWAFAADTDSEREPPWVVGGILAAATSTVLVAPPFSGKSWLGLHFAWKVAKGEPVFGRHVQKGVVVFVCGERYRETRKRLRQMRHAYDDNDPSIALFKKAPNLTNPDEVCSFLEELEAIADERGEISLVIIDTYAASMAGQDETSSGATSRAMTSVQAIIDATGAAVLLLHHPAKQGNDPRGHGGLVGSADAVMKLNDKDGLRTLTLTEANHDADVGATMAFRVEDGVVVEVDAGHDGPAAGRPAGRANRMTQHKRLEEFVLERLKTGAVRRRALIEAARDAAVVEGSTDATRKAFDRALDTLADRGLILGDGDLLRRAACPDKPDKDTPPL